MQIATRSPFGEATSIRQREGHGEFCAPDLLTMLKDLLQAVQNNAETGADWIKILLTGGGLATVISFIKSLIDGRNTKKLNDAQVMKIQEEVETIVWRRVMDELERTYTTNAQLKEALGERDRKIAALQYEIDEKTQRIQKLERVIGELRAGESKNVRHISDLEAEILLLQDKVKELEKERDVLREQLKKYQLKEGEQD